MPIKFIDEIQSDARIIADSFQKTGGNSSEFLKADGSTDSTSYQSELISGTSIKTVNGSTLLGSGDLVIDTTTSWGSITGSLSNQSDLQTVLDTKLTNSSTYIRDIVNETSGARDVDVSDVNNLIECNSATDTIISVVDGATSGMSVGDQVMYVKKSTGDVVFSSSGGTILALDGNTTVTADYGFAVLIYRGSDEYYLTGRLA